MFQNWGASSYKYLLGSPLLGKMMQFVENVSIGLVQPPPRKSYWYSFLVPRCLGSSHFEDTLYVFKQPGFSMLHPVDLYADVEGKNQQRKSYSTSTPNLKLTASLPLKINVWFRWVLSHLGRPSLFSEGINSRHLTWLDLHSEVGRNCAKKWVYLVTFDIDQWMQNAPVFSSAFLQVLCQIWLGI